MVGLLHIADRFGRIVFIRQQSMLIAMVDKVTGYCPLDQLRRERKLRDRAIRIEVSWVKCRLL